MKMAEVYPFRGVLYSPAGITDMAQVVTPPYDVITPREQEAFYQRHANNVIRLILGKAQPGDAGPTDVHTRAAGYFQEWMETKVLVRDDVPAFYVTSVSFTMGEKRLSRYGVIGCVRLEPFEKGIVLPHERTFSKVKTERLQLMQACHTNFSPIFGLYADSNGILKCLAEVDRSQTPDFDFMDDQGLGHKLWRITDKKIQDHITSALSDQCIYIADGHHRYETALNYRNWVRDNTPGFDDNHPANFVMMSLSSMNDPGMVILPAHRLLKDVPLEAADTFIDKAKAYFEILSFSTEAGMSQALDAFDATLAAHADRNAIGLYIKHQSALNVLILKNGIMKQMYTDELPEALRDLDVTVLTRLLMMELLGFDQNRLDDAAKIGYAITTQAAVQAVQEGQAEIAFILNPTKIEQVQKVSRQGLIMPRKSTYFYPKVGSGLVINPLR
jgi:uncharacterized protein (DUF1015 family)